MGVNTLCQEFEYDESFEVYWTYNWMVLQLEGCSNVIKALHPRIDFMFIFDHTCGREKDD